MKTLKLFVWALVAAMFVGCEPSPQGSVAQASPARSAPTRPVSWIGGGQTAAKIDDVLTRKNFLVLLDGSGSMSGSKIVQAKEAISRFSKKVPADANLGLVVFDRAGISTRVDLGTGNRPKFAKAVYDVVANDGTPLRSAITHSYRLLQAQALRQQGYGEYHLIVVTDGEANMGEDPTSIVNVILAESPVVLHTIGFQIGERHSLNQRGRILYKSADDQAGLERGLAEVLAEADKFN